MLLSWYEEEEEEEVPPSASWREWAVPRAGPDAREEDGGGGERRRGWSGSIAGRAWPGGKHGEA